MGQISLSLPVSGSPDSTEEPKIPSDFTIVQNVINGNLDSTNLAAALARSALVNQAGQTVKGVVVNPGPGTRTNTAYGNLSDAADSVSVNLASNGILRVIYQATWHESVSQAARAAIFVGGNQLQVQQMQAGGINSPGAGPIAAALGANSTNSDVPLFSCPIGLASVTATAGSISGDASTGQAVGMIYGTSRQALVEYGLVSPTLTATTLGSTGGACEIFAAAGTYTVGVQFKATSGTVTASNRKLWVSTLSFA